MKPVTVSPRSWRSRPMAVLGLLGSLGLAGGAAELAPAGDKSFALFMGADIDVERGKEIYRVKNVTGDALIIIVDGKPVEVPVNYGKIAMKVTPQLKLSDKTALVKELKFERDYTPEKNPSKKWGGVISGGGPQGVSDGAVGPMSAIQVAASMGSPRGGVPAASSGGNSLGQTVANIAPAVVDSGPYVNTAGYGALKLQEELDKELFDAIRVTGEISASRPVRDPYVVIVTQYRAKDDPPRMVRNWFYACQLDRLDETPLKVHILRGGFPEGFELIKEQLHVYGAGRELGTNLADKNVALTREEAHEYIVINYLAANRQATLAPSLALGVGYKDFFPHFVSEKLQEVIFVKVDQHGRPQGAFRDKQCTAATADDYLAALVARARFNPALAAGQAVEGVAKLKIAELAP